MNPKYLDCLYHWFFFALDFNFLKVSQLDHLKYVLLFQEFILENIDNLYT